MSVNTPTSKKVPLENFLERCTKNAFTSKSSQIKSRGLNKTQVALIPLKSNE